MKKFEVKPIIISCILVVFQSICFAISKLLSFDIHLIGGKIDELIPFNIYFIIPYISWYFLLFIVPYYLYKKDKTNFTKYCTSFILLTIVTNIIFICYPTTVNRTIVTGNDILSLLTRFIFWIDTPILNCFPSQHCAMSMLWILYVCNNKKSSKKVKTLITIDSILIMMSTLFVKQHVFVDFVSGTIISILIYLITTKDELITNKLKELFKIE